MAAAQEAPSPHQARSSHEGAVMVEEWDGRRECASRPRALSGSSPQRPGPRWVHITMTPHAAVDPLNSGGTVEAPA